MTQLRTLVPFALFGLAVAMLSCAPSSSSSGSGGAQQTSSGGSSDSGGANGTGGASAPGTGETTGSGGASSTGGASASGGSGSGGAAVGGSGSGGGGARADAAVASGGTGAPDAGTPDSAKPADAGAVPTCPAGVLLCDDFESYPAGTAPNGQWATTTKGAGAAIVDTMQAHSGTKAVHFSGSVNKDEAYIRASSAPVFPVTSDTLFVRFMMYVQYYPTADPMHVRFSWVGTSGVSSNKDGAGYTMCTYNGVAVERIASGYLRDTTQAMTQSANQNKWVCWEWEISNTEGPAAGEGGKVLPRIWREGTPLTLNMAGSKENWNPASFDLVQFSLFAYQSDPKVAHYWFDDIAVSKTRIGCPTK